MLSQQQHPYPGGNDRERMNRARQAAEALFTPNGKSRRDSSQSEDDLIGRALHQHKLHFSEVYGLRRDQSGRIFLKNDRLVFHEGE